jgi:glycopeptide antibiotics resistance protein
MDYIVSSADPHIAPVYFVMAAIIAILTAVVTLFHRRRGKITTPQSIALTSLTTYVFLVFSSTVFSRTPTDDYSYEWMLFWSYREIMRGSESLFWEDIFNVLMLLPVGVLASIVMKPEMKGKETNRLFFAVMLIGFLTSLIIEILQLVTKRGLFEFDDIFHNTLGVAIGELGYWMIGWKVRNRSG